MLISKKNMFLCHWGRSWRAGAPIGTGMWRSKGRHIRGVKTNPYTVKKISGLTDEQYNAIMLSKYGSASSNDYFGKKAAKDFLSRKEGVHTANIIASLPEKVEQTNEPKALAISEPRSGLSSDQYDAIMKSRYDDVNTDYFGKKAAKDFLNKNEGTSVKNIIGLLPEKVDRNKKQYQEPKFEREDLESFQNRISKKPDKEPLETPEVIYSPGKKQYQTAEISAKKKYQEPNIERVEIEKYQEPKQPLSSTDANMASRYFSTASTATDNISKGISKAWENIHNAKYKDEDRSKYVRSLTNDELRQVITRIELDQKYNNLTMPPKSKGYDRTMAALAVLGAAASVTATGLSIAAGVKRLKGK